MARTIRNQKLDSRTARRTLKPRREPYWVTISTGCALGYRRLEAGRGTWIARFRGDDKQRHYQAIGAADDVRDPDDVSVFNFTQAQKRAHAFFQTKANEISGGYSTKGTYTVKDAIDDYLAARERRGDTSIDRDRLTTKGLILPNLGTLPVHKLTRRRLIDWITQVTEEPPRTRTAKGKPQNYRPPGNSEEYRRKRRLTANRVFSVLKAALNYAYREHKVAVVSAWAGFTPFTGVSGQRVRFFDDNEVCRLAAICEPHFRALLTAGILTGARYGDLSRLTVRDFDAKTNVLWLRIRKGRNKLIRVALTDEGRAFFEKQCRSKHANALILTRPDGSQWEPGHQARRMQDACKQAGIPHAGFHATRHTFASRLIMGGASFAVVADQLGHSSTREVERHYGHLAPDYVSESVRQAWLPTGVLDVPQGDKETTDARFRAKMK
jgi:integrase